MEQITFLKTLIKQTYNINNLGGKYEDLRR